MHDALWKVTLYVFGTVGIAMGNIVCREAFRKEIDADEVFEEAQQIAQQSRFIKHTDQAKVDVVRGLLETYVKKRDRKKGKDNPDAPGSGRREDAEDGDSEQKGSVDKGDREKRRKHRKEGGDAEEKALSQAVKATGRW